MLKRSFVKVSVAALLVVVFNANFSSAGELTDHESQLAQRRDAYLEWVMVEFGKLEPTMKPFDGRAWSLNQARLYLNHDTAKATQYFEAVRLTADPDFMGIRLLKTWLDFGDSDRLSQHAKNNLQQILRNWPMDRVRSISRVATWPPTFTENHDLMHLAIGMFSQQLRGEDIQAHLNELKKSLSWRFERGFYEWGSHRYQLHYSNALQVLAEYAPDADIRRGAKDLFDLILAERALMSVGGYLGGPGMRSYGRNRGCDYLDNNRYDSFLPTVWLALGVGEPRFDFSKSDGLEPAGDGYGNTRDPRLNQDEAMFLATNSLKPHAILYDLLDEVSHEPELVYVGRRSSAGHPFQNSLPSNRRSHQVVHYYNTPHVSLGSLQYLPYAGKMSVSYNSRPRIFSVMFRDNPSQVLRTRFSDEALGAGKNVYNYRADRVVQHRNWLLAAGDLSASHGLKSRKVGAWDLFQVGRGLCAHIELEGNWHVFQVADLDQYRDEESFIAVLKLPTVENDTVHGVATNGDRIAVNLSDMSVAVNDVLRPPQVTMLHDSPFMTSAYGSGKITVKTRSRVVVFDNSRLRPAPAELPTLGAGQTRWGNSSETSSTTKIAHVRAMGGIPARDQISILKSVSILIPRNVKGTARLAVYAGGKLDEGPHAGTAARLLYDFGETAVGDAGWVTIKHPGAGIEIPANTPVWFAWKAASGSADITYQELHPPASGFQATRGRWDSKTINPNAGAPWPKSWPRDDEGGFDAAWYSCFMTLEEK